MKYFQKFCLFLIQKFFSKLFVFYFLPFSTSVHWNGVFQGIFGTQAQHSIYLRRCKRKGIFHSHFALLEPQSLHHYWVPHSTKIIQVLQCIYNGSQKPLHYRQKRNNHYYSRMCREHNFIFNYGILEEPQTKDVVKCKWKIATKSLHGAKLSLFRQLMACLHCKEPSVCICYFKITLSLLLGLVILGIPFPLCHMVHGYCSFQYLL